MQKYVTRRNSSNEQDNSVGNGDMTIKTAFNWNDGTPSIFSNDETLRRHIAGKKSAATQQKNQGIGKKKPISAFALARANKK
jgi:hypothetical protein